MLGAGEMENADIAGDLKIVLPESGINIMPPVVQRETYNILEPAVDADWNDIDGIHSHILRAPLGTYMGWNYRAANFGEGDLCDLTGSYIPFAVTKPQRIANNDPRPSLEERYGSGAGYGCHRRGKRAGRGKVDARFGCRGCGCQCERLVRGGFGRRAPALPMRVALEAPKGRQWAPEGWSLEE